MTTQTQQTQSTIPTANGIPVSTAATALLAALHNAGAWQRAEWSSNPRPAAASKHVTLRKVVTGKVRTGVDYANLAVNDGREIGPIRNGEWAVFPYLIRSTRGKELIRLYVHSIESVAYYVDGVHVGDGPTMPEEYARHLTPSARKPKPAPIGGCITPQVANVRMLPPKP